MLRSGLGQVSLVGTDESTIYRGRPDGLSGNYCKVALLPVAEFCWGLGK